MQSIADQLTDAQVFNGHDACEMGYPWITREAIRFVDSLIQPGFKVLECGVGGSTVFFYKKGCTVLAIESSAQWCDRVRKLVHPSQVMVHEAQSNDGFLSVIKDQADGAFDVVSIDSDPKCTDRLDLLNAAVIKLKDGGWLMLDNYGTFNVDKFVPPTTWEIHKFDQTGWAGSGTAILRKR